MLRSLNRRHLDGRGGESQLEARIEAYELAFRMQSAAPAAVDFADETPETLELYGIDQKETDEFGRRCLLARRLVERGVRFVQLYSGDTNGWDAHNNVADNHGTYCRTTDKPVAGLLRDLARRGLLDDTLVIWGGEFGRMPMSEQGKGRDHNPWGYSVVLAGAGVRGGFAYGATDEFGLRAAENTVHVHDLHATILHLLGLDHEALDLVPQRPRRAADRRGRPRGQGDPGMNPRAMRHLLLAAPDFRQRFSSPCRDASRLPAERPITADERNHWAYQPIAVVEPPTVDDPRFAVTSDRSLRARGHAGWRRRAAATRGQGHAGPPAVVRSDRLAAEA